MAYFRPTTLDEGLDIRAARPVAILAGGTDIFPAKTARAGWGDMRHPDVLDISAVAELRGITETEEHFRFGALTTWTELRRAVLPPVFAGYQDAAGHIGGVQVQNCGTLAGNLCTASPAGDGVPCLLALDGAVELACRSGRRTLPISSFMTGYRETACRADEIVTAVLVPKSGPAARGRFEKLGARKYLVISIVMAAAVLEADGAGRIASARVAVGACSPVAQRLPALEHALRGAPLQEAARLVQPEHLGVLSPIDDVRASAAYRDSAALQVVRDLLAGFAVSEARRAA